MESRDDVGVSNSLCTFLWSRNGCHKHNSLKDKVILSSWNKDRDDEIEEISFIEYNVPFVRSNVDKSANEFNLKVSVLPTLLDEFKVDVKVFLIDVDISDGTELSDIPDHSEQEDVIGLECSVDHCFQLVIAWDDLCTLRVRGQVNSESY